MTHPTALAFRRPPGILSPLSPFEGVAAAGEAEPSVLPAPTLSLLPGSDRGTSITDKITNDPTPGLNIDFAITYVAGNHFHIVVSSDTGGGFGAYSEVLDHELTTEEALAGAANDVISALPNGVHRLRARMSDDGSTTFSDYSDVITHTQNQALGAITSVSITGGGDTATVSQPTLTVTDGAVTNGTVWTVRHPDTGALWGTATADGTDETNGFINIDLDQVTLTPNNYEVTVTGEDGSNNLTADETYSFTVDIPLMDFSVEANSQYVSII